MTEFDISTLPEFPLPRVVAKKTVEYNFGTNMEGISLHLYVEQGDIAVLENRGGDAVDVSHEGATLRMTKTQFNERYTELPKQEKGQYISYHDYLSLEPGEKFAVCQIKENIVLPMDFEVNIEFAEMAKDLFRKKYRLDDYGITWIAILMD